MNNSSESYLDNLLKSIENVDVAKPKTAKREQESTMEDNPDLKDSNSHDINLDEVDLDDIDLGDINLEDINLDNSDIDDIIALNDSELDDIIALNDSELDDIIALNDSDIDDIIALNDSDLDSMNELNNSELDDVIALDDNDLDNIERDSKTEENEDLLFLDSLQEENEAGEVMQEVDNEKKQKNSDEDSELDSDLLELLDMISPIQEKDEKESNDQATMNTSDEDMMALLDSLDNFGGDALYNSQSFEEESKTDEVQEDTSSDFNDIFSLDEFINDDTEEEKYSIRNKSNNDVGDILSDALSAVSSHEEYEMEQELMDLIPPQKDKKKKKEGLFKKLFSNIKDETKPDTSKMVNEDEVSALEVESNEDRKQKKKKNTKKAKNSKTKNNAKKNSIAKGLNVDDENFEEEDIKHKSNKKSKLKKSNKTKNKEKKKAEQVVEEIEDEGRINPVGATIVFIFAFVLIVAVVFGSTEFDYSISIKNATNYFGRQKYTKAYDEVYGLTVKERDMLIYEKIVTVMYVNKQLNSYNNYYAMDKQPEALDSLLKGLEKYDQYIAKARELGIEIDFDFVRKQLVQELKNTFNLTEKQAYDLIALKKNNSYTLAVVEKATK